MPSPESVNEVETTQTLLPRPLPGTRVGDYILEETIGAGGMGVVYRVRQISLKRVVALKVLKTELSSDARYLARFYSEVRLLAQMSHPNIVQVIEGGFDSNCSAAYFAMEYVEGCDLGELLSQGHEFSVKDVLLAAYQTSSALAYAWDKFSMIHRDVKPANIIMTSPGVVKLLDLGISKRMTQSAGVGGALRPPSLTAHNEMVGSPAYVSPEQAACEQDLDFRADMYSLGVTMYQLLSGVLPYDSKNSFEVVTMHFNSPVPDVRKVRSDVSRRVSHLIMRMMAKDREKRFDSWESLMAELHDILYGYRRRRSRAHAVRSALTRFLPFLAVFSILLMVGVVVYAALAVVLEEKDREVRVVSVPRDGEDVVRDESFETEAEAEERERLYRVRRDEFIEILEKRSRELEARGEFSEALKMWTEDLTVPEEFMSDPVYQTRFEISVNYLRRKISKIESGLSE